MHDSSPNTFMQKDWHRNWAEIFTVGYLSDYKPSILAKFFASTDIDECTETPWVCSQRCENLPGSYLCKCAAGYQKLEDGSSCKHTAG